MLAIIGYLKIIITSLFFIGYSGMANSLPATINPIFQPILLDLQYKTQVPLVLPAYIPYSNSGFKLYAILEEVSPFSYSIILGKTPNCNGGASCRLGYVSGKVITPITLPIEEEYEYNPNHVPSRSPELPGFISLAAGIKAYFSPYTCAASCSDSYLTWDQGGYRYTISIFGGDKNTLVKIANSTIAK